MKLFFDTNVLLDILARREPWVGEAAALLSLVEAGGASGFVAPHSLATIHYLLAKWKGRGHANQAIADLTRVVRVGTLDHDAVLQALSLGWSDFEDALQAVCALNAGAELLVTRDAEHFRGFAVPPASAAEVLALIRAKEESPPA